MPGKKLTAAVERAWYQGAPWLPLLYPFGYLTGWEARRRLRRFRRLNPRPPVPLLVVGNISVGGTGKTPMVIALCEYFQRQGKRVAVISRGYGARPASYPWHVTAEQSADDAGDEPLLIHRRTDAPVVIDPKRQRALDAVLAQGDVDLVISDDGLQHYALPRTVEVIMLDAERGLGNGRCLPAGPLREPAARLAEADYLVVNGRPSEQWPLATVMVLQADDPVNLKSGRSMPMEDFAVRYPLVHAFAGIGNPQRFFSALSAWDIRVTGHPMADHHHYQADDFTGLAGQTVIMTEKDAVKCADLATEDFWYLPVSARLPTIFFENLQYRLFGADG